MIQASRSPSRPGAIRLDSGAGPLAIGIEGAAGPTLELLRSTLSLYDVPWTLTPLKPVEMVLEVVPAPVSEPAHGGYLVCAQMLVDARAEGLRATTSRGALMTGAFESDAEIWHMVVPQRIPDEGWWPEVEDLVSLVVTTGWRRAGWVPLHAAGLVRDGTGVLVCAASRGGKTTFSLAMARRGWRVVGDDKLLLGSVDGTAVTAAVKHMLNVDPAAREWFAEVGDLDHLPLYSEWSPKRRVALASIFPEAPAADMRATHVLALSRSATASVARVEEMDVAETLSTLLHQTVIPSDRATARRITGTLADIAQASRGLRCELPENIYHDPGAIAAIERALV